ncbi:MAG: DUF6717 family protein [Limisphaerales bacterium]
MKILLIGASGTIGQAVEQALSARHQIVRVGNWYFSPEFKIEGWLCPALFKYFDQAPTEIYVKAEPKT